MSWEVEELGEESELPDRFGITHLACWDGHPVAACYGASQAAWVLAALRAAGAPPTADPLPDRAATILVVANVWSGNEQVPIHAGQTLRICGEISGCSVLGGGDLYDHGLRQEDIAAEGVTIRASDFTVVVTPRLPPTRVPENSQRIIEVLDRVRRSPVTLKQLMSDMRLSDFSAREYLRELVRRGNVVGEQPDGTGRGKQKVYRCTDEGSTKVAGGAD